MCHRTEIDFYSNDQAFSSAEIDLKRVSAARKRNAVRLLAKWKFGAERNSADDPKSSFVLNGGCFLKRHNKDGAPLGRVVDGDVTAEGRHDPMAYR